MIGHVRTSQVRKDQAGTGRVRTVRVRTGQVRTGQVRTGQELNMHLRMEFDSGVESTSLKLLIEVVEVFN